LKKSGANGSGANGSGADDTSTLQHPNWVELLSMYYLKTWAEIPIMVSSSNCFAARTTPAQTALPLSQPKELFA